MARILAVFISLFLVATVAFGQSAGDFRSKVTTGDWNNNTSWETFSGGTWINAVAPPAIGDGVITILNGHTINFTTDDIIDQVVIASGGRLVNAVAVNILFPAPGSPTDMITVNAGGTLDNFGIIQFSTNTVVRVNGTLTARNASTLTGPPTASNLIFQGTSAIYEHIATSTAGTIPQATWSAGSTTLIRTTTALPSGLAGQTLGGVRFDCASGGTLNLGGVLTNLAGGFSTASSNVRTIVLNSVGSYTLNVAGDFSIGGGTLNISAVASATTNTITVGSYSQTGGTLNFFSAATNATATATFNVKGDFNRTAGNISKNSSTLNTNGVGIISFMGTTQQNFTNTGNLPFSATINFNVQPNSILNLGTTALTGGGTFTLLAGGKIMVGASDANGALATGTGTGNIRVSGSRTYTASASPPTTIEYTSTAVALGNNHPLIANITTIINSPNILFLPSPTTINNDIILSGGNLDITGKTVTFTGAFTPNTHFLVTTAATNITISDVNSIAAFSLKTTGSSVIGGLTISGSTGRNVLLNTDISVNQYSQTIGSFLLNGHTLTVNGGLDQLGGTITSDAAAGLVITDTGVGSLPADLVMGGGAINTITMNRSGDDLFTSSNLDITNLNLLAGSFTHTGTVRMNTNGKITISDGTLTNAIGAVTTYDVEYNGFNDLTTGLELTGSGVDDVVNLKAANLFLSADAVIGGTLTLSDGNFVGNAFNVTLRGNFVSDAASDFTGGTVFMDGATTMTGVAAPQFDNLTINSPHSFTIDPTSFQINLAGHFINNGTFTASQSTVLLNGSADQNIGGAGPNDFYNIEINKGSNDVNIQSAASIANVLSLASVTTINAGSNLLTLRSNATRTARVSPIPVGASIVGSVIVQQYLPNGNNTAAYRYVATPVMDTFVSDWKAEIPVSGTFTDPSTGPGISSANPSLYYYDETFVLGGPGIDDRYRNYPATGLASAAALDNGKGYALFVRGTVPVTFDHRGTLGQQERILTVTAQSNAGVDGWNLLGNPYPSPVVWDNVILNGGVENAIYVRDNTDVAAAAGSYVTYVGGVSTPLGFDGMLSAGQAFWVHATADGDVTFEETDKIADSNIVPGMYRTGTIDDLLRVNISGASGADQTVVRFESTSTMGMDRHFDALKLSNALVSFATVADDGREMTINTMPGLECGKSIQLSTKNMKIGAHTIAIEGQDSFNNMVGFILKDAVTGGSFDLRKGPYAFTVTAANLANTSRFKLEVSPQFVKDLAVGSNEVCFDQLNSSISLTNSQPGVEYSASYNGTTVSDWITGTGDNISLNVAVKQLPAGANDVTIMVRNTCLTDALTSKAVITKKELPTITKVDNATACKNGEATIAAYTAVNGGKFNWYKGIDDAQPFTVTTASSLLLTGQTASKSYYVAVETSSGCQSPRMKVDVTTGQYPDATITRTDNTLTSNYTDGNQWYLDGTAIPGSTGKTIEVTQTGQYSLKVNVNGCSTEASAPVNNIVTAVEDNLGMGIEAFSYYPNPVSDKVHVAFNVYEAAYVDVTIMTTTGVELAKKNLSLQKGRSEHVISIPEAGAGVYFLRVVSDGKSVVKKLIKL